MVKKSDIVRAAVVAGNYKEALRIAKDFRIGISKEDSDAMKRGYECMATSPKFYESIGVDVSACISKGIEVVVKIYG